MLDQNLTLDKSARTHDNILSTLNPAVKMMPKILKDSNNVGCNTIKLNQNSIYSVLMLLLYNYTNIRLNKMNIDIRTY